MTYTYETLTPGHVYRTQRTVTPSDVMLYRTLVGEDTVPALSCAPEAGYWPQNPFPTDSDLAPNMLILSYVWHVLGTVFPGQGTAIVSLTNLFVSRVRAGGCVEIEIVVAEKVVRHHQLRVRVAVREGRRLVMAGEAVLMPPSL